MTGQGNPMTRRHHAWFLGIIALCVARLACAAPDDYDTQDVCLNAAYKALFASLDGAGRKALRDEERQWILGRDTMCKVPVGTVVKNQCTTTQTRFRADELEKRLKGRAAKPAARRRPLPCWPASGPIAATAIAAIPRNLPCKRPRPSWKAPGPTARTFPEARAASRETGGMASSTFVFARRTGVSVTIRRARLTVMWAHTWCPKARNWRGIAPWARRRRILSTSISSSSESRRTAMYPRIPRAMTLIDLFSSGRWTVPGRPE